MFHLFVRVMLLQGKIFCNIFATVVLAVEILVSRFGLSDFFLLIGVTEMLCERKKWLFTAHSKTGHRINTSGGLKARL